MESVYFCLEPLCMDRLRFASENSEWISEVADMYPACLSTRGSWPFWEYARALISLADRP